MMNYILPKAFFALDGVSFLIVEVDEACSVFTVHFIPDPLRLTTFELKREGDLVNLELDRMTRTLVDTAERTLRLNSPPMPEAQPVTSGVEKPKDPGRPSAA